MLSFERQRSLSESVRKGVPSTQHQCVTAGNSGQLEAAHVIGCCTRVSGTERFIIRQLGFLRLTVSNARTPDRNLRPPLRRWFC